MCRREWKRARPLPADPCAGGGAGHSGLEPARGEVASSVTDTPTRRPAPADFAAHCTRPMAELKRRYGACNRTIRRWMEECGQPRPPRPSDPRFLIPPPADLAEVQRGRSMEQLALHYRRDRRTIRRWLVELGLERPPIARHAGGRPAVAGSSPHGGDEGWHLNRAAADAARIAATALLSAQLRTGQHNLLFARAIEVGAALGLHAFEIRPVEGDPTVSHARGRRAPDFTSEGARQ